jgi:hypothetical protein
MIRFFWAVLEFELRASFLLGGHCTTSAIPPALLCFSYFTDRILCFCLGLPQTDPPTYDSHIAGIAGTYYHFWPLIF